MKSYRGPAETINNWPNSSGSDILSDAVVVLKSGAAGQIAVADGLIVNGGTGTLYKQGIFELPALSTDTGAVGDIVYWDAGNSRITTTSTSNTYAGRLHKAKANPSATAFVDLNARSAA